MSIFRKKKKIDQDQLSNDGRHNLTNDHKADTKQIIDVYDATHSTQYSPFTRQQCPVLVPVQPRVIDELEKQFDNLKPSLNDIAKIIIDLYNNNKQITDKHPDLTPTDLLDNSTCDMTYLCMECLKNYQSVQLLKHSKIIDNLPKIDTLKADTDQSFKSQLQYISTISTNSEQFNQLIKQACLQAAQNNHQSITFYYQEPPYSSAYHLNADRENGDPSNELTLAILCKLYPDHFKINPITANDYQTNHHVLDNFITQLKVFALHEHLIFTTRTPNASQPNFNITLSWNPSLSLNDAIAISNETIQKEHLKNQL